MPAKLAILDLTSFSWTSIWCSGQALHELVGGSTGKTVLAGASDDVVEGWKLVIEGVGMFVDVIEISTEVGAEEVGVEWVLADSSLDEMDSCVIESIVAGKIDDCVTEDERGLMTGEFGREEVIKVSGVVELRMKEGTVDD